MSSPDHESTSERMDAVSDALSRLVRRQAEIENRLERIETALRLDTQAAQPEPTSSEPTPPPLPPDAFGAIGEQEAAPPIPPPQPAQFAPQLTAQLNTTKIETTKPEAPKLETRLGLNWLNRVAIVTLTLGVAFFFKYAVDNEWVGPGTRVALGLVAATLSLVIGAWQSMRGQKIFAQGMTGLGLAIFYLSFYATFGFYHLLPKSVAFVLMALTTAAAGGLAYHFDSQAVAILGLIGGYVTPAVLFTGDDPIWSLFGYGALLNSGSLALAYARRWRAVAILGLLGGYWLPMLLSSQENRLWTLLGYTIVLNLGSLALAQVRRWPALAYVSLLATMGLYAGWSAEWLNDDTRAAGFTWLSITFLLFFVASIRWTEGPALGILVLNASTYFVASYYLLDPQYHRYVGAFTAALGLLYGVLALRSQTPAACKLAAGIAAVLITLAVPIQFTGFRITIIWALEAAALAWLGRRFQSDLMETGAGLLFGLALFRLLVQDAWTYGAGNSYTPIANARFLTFLVSAASLWFHSWVARSKAAGMASYIAGHFVFLCALGLEVIGWAERTVAARDVVSTETTALSLLMAAYALTLVTAGVTMRSSVNRLMGLSLMALVVVKLYLIDVWTLSRGFRITAFLGLGALLLLASYLYSRFKPAIEKLWKDPADEPMEQLRN